MKFPKELRDSQSKYFNRDRNFYQRSFKIGIFIKGIDGILEIGGGFLLMLVNPIRLNHLVLLLTQHELTEDPNDVIANFLLRTSSKFSVSTQHFGIIYLLIHGIVKLFIVGMLRRQKLWAYPFTIVFLGIFVVYQLYRFTTSHSIWLIVLAFMDTVIILLTWKEYRRIKMNQDPTGDK